MTKPNSLQLVRLALIAAAACRAGPMSIAARDASYADNPGAGGRSPVSIPGIGGAGAGGGMGTGGAVSVGGAGGAAFDASDDCSFGKMWGEMVYQAAVIGYCRAVAACDSAAATADAGTASCSLVTDLGEDTIVFERGTLIIKGPHTNMGCFALVFDDQGRLVDGRVNISGWADCRWPLYAGKSLYYYCVSE